MTSFFSSWLNTGISAAPAPAASKSNSEEQRSWTVPELQTISPPASDEEDDGNDTDTPPAFPSLSSAQRLNTPSLPRVLTDSKLMPPPPQAGLAVRQPGPVLQVPSSQSSSLALPPSTTKRPSQSKKREKVALAPGHSPLDWASLKSSGQDLRGVDSLLRISPSVLKMHNTQEDAWTAIYGKVYNITPYLAFHPGGVKDLMRVAGRDGTKLFATTHAWVNVDFMLDTCLVGFLVPEPAS